MDAKTITAPVVKVAQNRTVQIILVAALVLGFVYYLGRKLGEKYMPPVAYPDGGKTLPADWQKQGDILVDQAHAILYGLFKRSDERDELFVSMLALSNDQLTYMYNRWGAAYYKEKGDSLTQAIDDVYVYGWLTGNKKKIVNKMKTLGLY